MKQTRDAVGWCSMLDGMIFRTTIVIAPAVVISFMPIALMLILIGVQGIVEDRGALSTIDPLDCSVVGGVKLLILDSVSVNSDLVVTTFVPRILRLGGIGIEDDVPSPDHGKRVGGVRGASTCTVRDS